MWAARCPRCSSTLSGGGAIVILTPSGWRNATVVRNVWRLVAKYRPQTFSAVPTVLAASLSVPAEGSRFELADLFGGRRVGHPRGGLQGPAGADAHADAGGLRHDGDLQRAYDQLSGPAGAPRVGGPCPALQPRARVQLDEEGKLERECEVNEIGVVAMAGSRRVLGLPESGTQPARVRGARLGEFRRPGPPGSRGLSVDHGPRQGPHHPRRPQHRPAADRGDPLPAPGCCPGRRRGTARCACGRVPGRLRPVKAA